jgi:hypothetical protein
MALVSSSGWCWMVKKLVAECCGLSTYWFLSRWVGQWVGKYTRTCQESSKVLHGMREYGSRSWICWLPLVKQTNQIWPAKKMPCFAQISPILILPWRRQLHGRPISMVCCWAAMVKRIPDRITLWLCQT